MLQIRQFIESIKSLWAWLPIVWKDRQWDSWYTERILLHKVTLQRNAIQERQAYYGWENDVKWANYCIYLLTMLIENKYWEDEWDTKRPNRRGFSESFTKHQGYLDLHYSDDYNGVNADLWEDKTRTLFWKIFTWRYQYWWD